MIEAKMPTGRILWIETLPEILADLVQFYRVVASTGNEGIYGAT